MKMFIIKSPYLLGAVALILSGCNLQTPQQSSNLDMGYECPVVHEEGQCLAPQATPSEEKHHQLRTLILERQELKRQLEIERQQKRLARELEAAHQRKAYIDQKHAFQREQQALKNQHSQLRQELDRHRQEQKQTLKAERNL